jgi:hypothetical protein
MHVQLERFERYLTSEQGCSPGLTTTRWMAFGRQPHWNVWLH